MKISKTCSLITILVLLLLTNTFSVQAQGNQNPAAETEKVRFVQRVHPLQADLSLAQLAEISHKIAVGQIVRIEPTLSPSGVVMRVVSFRISKTLKEAQPSFANEVEIPIVVAGGRFADRETIVSGSPEFRVGEEVLLFLSRDEKSHYGIWNLSQGTYRISKDDSGKSIAVGTEATKGIALSELEARIKTVLTQETPTKRK